MKLMPRVHDWYVGRAVLFTVLLTWAVLLGLDVVNAFASEAKSIGQGSYSFGHAIAFVAYTVPRRAYTLFPTAAVIGALMGLGQLAATSELTALRALGVSRKRMSASVVVAMALLTATMVISGETVGPWAQSQADTLKTSARYQSDMTSARYSGLWAREGDTFLNALSGEEQLLDNGGTALTLHDVRLYHLDAKGQMQQLTYAAVAEHRDGRWTLRQVRRDTFQERSVQRETFPNCRGSRSSTPRRWRPAWLPRNLSVHDLGQSIEYRRRNGLDASDYEDQYWSRWFYPLNVLALCLAAIPFSFGSLRSGGLGKRLFLGILFALGFWLLQLFFGRMAGALKLDYRIAYALPPMVMLGVSAWLFRRRSS